MDTNVGRVLDALDESGLSGNTIVIFMSVPVIVKYPGRIAPGSTSSRPVMCADLFPTLLELAGLPPERAREVDGFSFAGELLGRPSGDRPPLY